MDKALKIVHDDMDSLQTRSNDKQLKPVCCIETFVEDDRRYNVFRVQTRQTTVPCVASKEQLLLHVCSCEADLVLNDGLVLVCCSAKQVGPGRRQVDVVSSSCLCDWRYTVQSILQHKRVAKAKTRDSLQWFQRSRNQVKCQACGWSIYVRMKDGCCPMCESNDRAIARDQLDSLMGLNAYAGEKAPQWPARPSPLRILATSCNGRKLHKQPDNSLRVVVVSDTHNRVPREIPGGDVLIHCGDATNCGRPEGVRFFKSWFDAQPHKVKIAVPGNHDICAHPLYRELMWRRFFDEKPQSFEEYPWLIDDAVVVKGVRFYGSPWVTPHHDWAFNVYSEDERQRKWQRIPDHVDVLITHSPPAGHLSSDYGCEALRKRVEQLEPVVHLFGHVHSEYGMMATKSTLFINAAICTSTNKPAHAAQVFDIELP